MSTHRSTVDPPLAATPAPDLEPDSQVGTRGVPTLEEVAARAGVSRATASRVLRGASNVSDRARERVTAAAAAINYTPNLAARSLATGRSDSIAFVIDESEERLFSDRFFLGALRGVHDVASEAGMQLVLTVMSQSSDQERFVRFAAGGHLDGVLLLSLHGHDQLPRQLEELGVPVVLGGRPPGWAPGLSFVDVDNVDGGRLATAHLLSLGRRHVATICGSLDLGSGQDRLQGYRQAMEAAGRADEEIVVESLFTSAGGYQAMRRLLAEHPQVDAVFAASDLVAVGAIRAIRESGRSVPQDIAVVGFDDMPGAADVDPPLTTVAQPMAEFGIRMTRMLLDRITGADGVSSVVLPVELVRRRSA